MTAGIRGGHYHENYIRHAEPEINALGKEEMISPANTSYMHDTALRNAPSCPLGPYMFSIYSLREISFFEESFFW